MYGTLQAHGQTTARGTVCHKPRVCIGYSTERAEPKVWRGYEVVRDEHAQSVDLLGSHSKRTFRAEIERGDELFLEHIHPWRMPCTPCAGSVKF